MDTLSERASSEPARYPSHNEGQLHYLDNQYDNRFETEFPVPPGRGLPGTRVPKFVASVIWMAVNVLASIGIVFTNKAIFSDPSLKLCQLSFASFHFAVTWCTLFVLSRPQLAYFVPRHASTRQLLPLAFAMCLNVILPNLSLAYSSVTFYQVVRILLTPTIALMNFVFYGITLPLLAVVALIPVCMGVGVISFYESIATDSTTQTTSPLGVGFAFAGILASSLYTRWIASYHKKLQMSSMQLLFNQAPIASFLLLYAIPFLDNFPDWRQVSADIWFMIGLSGVLASLINVSQFFIVNQTSPISSTVVGHLKMCTIVARGWVMSSRPMGDIAALGMLVAVGGIIAYSIVMLGHNTRESR